jgi:hypothetical protein
VDEQPAIQRRLLAGSIGPDRRPVRPGATEPRWFEAPHVRDPRAARDRLADQVAAGADVVVAPTWQTHRRALLAVGETRQARAWTAAAVRIGRESIEVGLERAIDVTAEVGGGGAEGGGGGAEADDGPTASAASASPSAVQRRLRAAPLLAASLPALDETPEPGAGRLLSREAASERDYRDQAGLLADSAPDLILVEGQSTVGEARLAVEAALDAGLPVWVALDGLAGDGDAAARLTDALGGRSVECLLLDGVPPARPPSSPPTWGGLLNASAAGTTAERWLDAGARVLAVLDGATPSRLGPVRAAIDRAEDLARQAAREDEERWWAHVRRAAAMAEGGAALWLLGRGEDAPRTEQLPGGFEWVVVPRGELHLLPEGRFRLAVSPPATGSSIVDVGRSLDEGGILAWAGDPGASGAASLRIVIMDGSGSPGLAILRREP